VQMAAEQIPPAGARCDAPWATLRGRHRPLSPDPPLQSHASLPPGGEPTATRARRTRMVGRRPARAVRGGGRAQNAKFVQGPYGAGRGAARPMVGDRAGRVRLVVPAGRGMRFPCKDPMERGVGQQGRDGRVRTGRHGWRLWRGAECDFHAKTLWSGAWASRAGMVGFGPDGTAGGCGGARNAISRGDPLHWGAGALGSGGTGERGTGERGNGKRAGRAGFRPEEAAGGCGRGRNAKFVQRPYGAGAGPGGRDGRRSDGPRGRRLWPGAECDFHAKTLGSSARGHAFWTGARAVGTGPVGFGQGDAAGRRAPCRDGWPVLVSPGRMR
jgi:hypothetical protein